MAISLLRDKNKYQHRAAVALQTFLPCFQFIENPCDPEAKNSTIKDCNLTRSPRWGPFLWETIYIYTQEAPDSYACLNQSTANRTKSTNISKCKKYIQTWCNFQGKCTAGSEIYLNWAIKGTRPVEI